jgi:nucleoid-associated protein YgaU
MSCAASSTAWSQCRHGSTTDYDAEPPCGWLLSKDAGELIFGQADREKAVLVVGNTKGIAQVDDQITVETPAPEATYYTVQRGDTLSKIAREHYHDASKYPVIFEANRPMLKDPDKIYPGQKLRIPPL